MIFSSAMGNVGSHELYTWIDIFYEGHSCEAELLIGSVYRVSCGYLLKTAGIVWCIKTHIGIRGTNVL